MRVAVVTSHPIQYQAPWFRGLAAEVDLHVYFAHQVDAGGQGAAGYGVAFEWDVDLLAGYQHTFLQNVARTPGVLHFSGCDTPDIREHLQRTRPDACIVTGWYLKTYWQTIAACRALGIPILVRGDSQLGTARSWTTRVGKEVLYRWLVACFDGFLCVGRRNMEYLLHYGAGVDRIVFVPHFVDNAYFRDRSRMAPSEREDLRTSLGIASGEVVVLFVGRFVAFKHPGDLLTAVALLPAALRVRPVFIGAGALESRLRQRATALAPQPLFLGFRNQSELPRLYGAADVLVLPSDATETWGLVVNEAMACGLPVVVSDAVGCAPDMIEPGVTGETYAWNAPKSLAAALERVIARLNAPSVQRAIEKKLTVYNAGAAVGATVHALRSVVRGTSAASPRTHRSAP